VRVLAGETLVAPDMPFILPSGGGCGWFSAVYSPHYNEAGRIVGVIGIVRDVTDRRRIEDTLHASEEKYRLLVENAKEVIYIAQDARICFINRAVENVTGYAPDELVGRSFAELVHPDERDTVIERDHRRIHVETPVRRDIVRIQTKDKDVRWMEVNSVLIEWQGRPATLNFLNDITQRRQLDEARRISEERFRAIYENAPLAFVMWGNKYQVSDWNHKAEELFGWSKSEVLGRNFFDFMVPKSLHAHVMGVVGGTLEHGIATHEISRNLTQDGGMVWCEWVNIPMKDSEGRVVSVLALALDATERLRAEERLHEAQKMDAMGRLAGGVAHDFNNLLMIIGGYAEMLRKKLPEGSPDIPRVEGIREAAQRASVLTQQLLAFGRKQTIHPRPICFNAVVHDNEEMLRGLLDENMSLDLQLDPGLGFVLMDPRQVSQILINMVMNARDAMMPRGGKLTLDASNVDLAGNLSHGMTAGPYIQIRFADQGRGMSREVMEHLFEPFFTTKGRDTGGGLGLSSVYGMVTQAHGRIFVESEEGHGATFILLLPRCEPSLEGQATALPEEGEGVGGAESILLVEDELRVREFVTEILRAAGYRVTAASGAQEALELIHDHAGDFRLLLSDVVMPGMSGTKFARMILEKHPGIAVILMSGYTEGGEAEELIRERDVTFLAKPVASATLLRSVRRVLDQAAPLVSNREKE
jgi:PAS domain S-box-containing protein